MQQKLYLGYKLRRFREQQGMTQAALAEAIGLSSSYLNQLENNQRPLTAAVLVKLSQAFEIDIASFADDDQDRLVADLREALADPAFHSDAISLQELKAIVATSPALAQHFLLLHRAQRKMQDRLQNMDDTLSANEQASGLEKPLFPYEEVRDYFHYRNNYIDELDLAAEQFHNRLNLSGVGSIVSALFEYIKERHDVRTRIASLDSKGHGMRRFDPETKTLTLSETISEASRLFLAAHQIALLEFDDVISGLIAESSLISVSARSICRVGLANYFAGAVIMPYRPFLEAARSTRHDIERLQHQFSASFEQVCHRLSTLQRPSARGIPFYFVRVDKAGNITKRHSATRFQFARFGGACPLWNVHEAFAVPGQVLVQMAEMPDGVRYICVARSIIKRSGSYSQPNRHYALGIGCEVSYAPQLVYAQGLDLKNRNTEVPIGVSCRICERENCQQRAFPPIDRSLFVDHSYRDVVPYQFTEPATKYT